MADHDPPEISLPPPAAPGARCPWCSAPIAGPDDVTCSVCGAALQGDAAIEIPGLTAIDGQHAWRAAAPRKVRRTFGALFVGGDDEIRPPSAAELPALAMPDADVRREMLRLQLDAELADLTARAAALAAERGIQVPAEPDPEPQPDAPRDADAPRGGDAAQTAMTDEVSAADATLARDASSPEEDAQP
jgi:hypothetical protein